MSRRVVRQRQQLLEFFIRWRTVYDSWVASAGRFNVFEALRIESAEVLHSRFLAFLLDPSARHDCGRHFLRSFLELIEFEQAPSDTALRSTRVCVELPIRDYGRLDVALFLASGDIVAIENKVWAGEQENQVAGYQEWIGARRRSNVDRSRVVFLSPSGEMPQTFDPGSTVLVRPLSYMQLAGWLRIVSEGVPIRLREVVDMYGDVCRAIWRLAI